MVLTVQDDYEYLLARACRVVCGGRDRHLHVRLGGEQDGGRVSEHPSKFGLSLKCLLECLIHLSQCDADPGHVTRATAGIIMLFDKRVFDAWSRHGTVSKACVN